jgi:hypothetical protein
MKMKEILFNHVMIMAIKIKKFIILIIKILILMKIMIFYKKIHHLLFFFYLEPVTKTYDFYNMIPRSEIKDIEEDNEIFQMIQKFK